MYRIVDCAKAIMPLSWACLSSSFHNSYKGANPFYSGCDGKVLITGVEYPPYFKRFMLEIRLGENMT
jgi:hypothetical protein